MTLICTYSNNKHLIELENKRLKEEEEGSQEDGQSHEQLKVRCNILEKEIVSLSN